MKKLLLLFLIASSCKGQSPKVTAKQDTTVQNLVIDENSLSNDDKAFIAYADKRSKEIDENSTLHKTLDTVAAYNNLPTNFHYVVYTLKESDEIAKIASSGKNEKQNLTYVYYYADGKAIKSENEVKDYPPFRLTVYFTPNKVITPKDISNRTAQAVQLQAIQFLDFFTKRN